ncbi:MAG: hypothetical protein QGI68_14450 [Pseudomonadales bacterium]|jgi:TolB-like protein|nr:hypothetical protein [Pseudomonadales bacterium]MDP7596747.1 hypothetical protein [Pseudomonadales bacterium]HJN51633.1 hypothetical protein [Pseudomonadales bacterium]|tara:strand:- start:2191 stop:3090 length:900 start_codon:yes stop_codon:yes gene_type:complete
MTPTRDEIQRQLERLLSSNAFTNANRSSRFLQFVVEKAAAGEGDRLKEYVIGVEVFDRDAQYDPRVDSIVRVEAGRLRTKIQEYYNGHGCEDVVIIRLPKGGYAPEFALRDSVPPEPSVDVAPNSSRSSLFGLSKSTARHAAVSIALAALLAVAVAAWRMDLWTSQNAASAPAVRIAVLPFHSYPGDAANQIMAARLTEKVTAELVRIGKLSVVASTSALQFKDDRGLLRDVAKALQADMLMEARLIAEGDSIRVEARISAGAVDQKFWVDDSFIGRDVDQLARQIAASATDTILARRQ